MTSNTSLAPETYDGPPPPREGQLFQDGQGGFWKVKRLTLAPKPVGFYLVHISYGASLDQLEDSLVLGPREFAAVIRDRDLKPHLHSVS